MKRVKSISLIILMLSGVFAFALSMNSSNEFLELKNADAQEKVVLAGSCCLDVCIIMAFVFS